MSQDYDRIIRDNFQELLPAIIRKVIRLDLQEMEILPTDLPVTLERRPDFVVQAREKQGDEPFLLHIEFQSQDDDLMHLRMLEYRAFLRRKFNLPVVQYVLYMGSQPSGMLTRIQKPMLDFSYRLVQLIDHSYEGFVRSSQPEEVILGILGDFQATPAQDVIEAILVRLKELSQQGVRIVKHLPQLEVLAKLRNLQKQTANTITYMPITYNLEEDIRFIQGEELGLKKGEELGLKKGEELGLKKGEELGLKKGEELGLKKGEELGLKKGEEQTEEEMIAITAQLVSEDFRSGKITLGDIAQRLKVPMARVEKMHRVLYPS